MMSSTSWKPLPPGEASIACRSTTTGSTTSMTIIDWPGAESPPRNDLTRPTGRSPIGGGSCMRTADSSTITRFGL